MEENQEENDEEQEGEHQGGSCGDGEAPGKQFQTSVRTNRNRQKSDPVGSRIKRKPQRSDSTLAQDVLTTRGTTVDSSHRHGTMSASCTVVESSVTSNSQ